MSEKQENFTLLNGRVKMIRGTYNPTSDAVWLAAYIPKKPENVLDVGIGTGGVSLCLLNHFPNADITGIDISDDMLNACKKNAEINNVNITLKNQDIYKWSTNSRYDLVITNPPYFNGTPTKANAQAHHNADLTNWIKRCCARVKPNGHICIVSDALCTDKIISVLVDKHFGNIQILPLFGAKNTAERVLIRAKQSAKTGTTIYYGVSMNNEYILRDGLTVDILLDTLKRP